MSPRRASTLSYAPSPEAIEAAAAQEHEALTASLKRYGTAISIFRIAFIVIVIGLGFLFWIPFDGPWVAVSAAAVTLVLSLFLLMLDAALKSTLSKVSNSADSDSRLGLHIALILLGIITLGCSIAAAVVQRYWNLEMCVREEYMYSQAMYSNPMANMYMNLNLQFPRHCRYYYDRTGLYDFVDYSPLALGLGGILVPILLLISTFIFFKACSGMQQAMKEAEQEDNMHSHPQYGTPFMGGGGGEEKKELLFSAPIAQPTEPIVVSLVGADEEGLPAAKDVFEVTMTRERLRAFCQARGIHDLRMGAKEAEMLLPTGGRHVHALMAVKMSRPMYESYLSWVSEKKERRVSIDDM